MAFNVNQAQIFRTKLFEMWLNGPEHWAFYGLVRQDGSVDSCRDYHVNDWSLDPPKLIKFKDGSRLVVSNPGWVVGEPHVHEMD